MFSFYVGVKVIKGVVIGARGLGFDSRVNLDTVAAAMFLRAWIVPALSRGNGSHLLLRASM